MGHVPPPPMPHSASDFMQWHGHKLRKELGRRHSRLPWRRRKAYQACLTLIKAREALLGMRADPWEIRAPYPGGLPNRYSPMYADTGKRVRG